MTCPLRSTGITPLHRYYGAVRPSPAHRYFRPHGWSRLRLFPWHRRPGSHVPYKSPAGGSLALASLNHASPKSCFGFPQRSPPWLLTKAACGGLRSAPDCRTRRTYLHLSYSYAAPFGPALLVTQDPLRSLAGSKFRTAASP